MPGPGGGGWPHPTLSPGLPWCGAGPGHPGAPPVPTQNSAFSLISAVSGKFSCLLQALEIRRAAVLKGIEAAKDQALTQAQDEERRLHSHLEDLAQYGHRVQGLLEQVDDQAFLQVPGLRAVDGARLPCPCAGAYCGSPGLSGVTAAL